MDWGERRFSDDATIPAPEWVALIGDGPARGWRHPSAIDNPSAGRGGRASAGHRHHITHTGMACNWIPRSGR